MYEPPANLQLIRMALQLPTTEHVTETQDIQSDNSNNITTPAMLSNQPTLWRQLDLAIRGPEYQLWKRIIDKCVRMKDKKNNLKNTNLGRSR